MVAVIMLISIQSGVFWGAMTMMEWVHDGKSLLLAVAIICHSFDALLMMLLSLMPLQVSSIMLS